MKSKVIIMVAAVVALSAGYWFSSQTLTSKEKELLEARKNFSPIQGSILSPPRNIVVPELVKDDGSTLTKADMSGHWSLIFFGYMSCPDVCPVTMGVTASAKKLAAEEGVEFPEVYFISVDPERDEVASLAEYVQYFDKDFVGVTGEEQLIKALTLQMSVVYMKMKQEDDQSENYLVDHSSALLLMNPEGDLVAFLNPPHDPETILNDYKIVKNLETKSL
jgi:protein SCO1/2